MDGIGLATVAEIKNPERIQVPARLRLAVHRNEDPQDGDDG